MNRHYPARYATRELAAQAKRDAALKRQQAKQHAQLLEAESRRIALLDAKLHERELDAPVEPDLD